MKRLVLPLVVLLLTAFQFNTVKVHADVNDFTINSFSADYTLNKTDPQGQLHIVETIDVTYTDNNHGIQRAIPKSYKGHSLNLRVNEVSSATQAPASYTTSSQSDNLVLRIGDPNRTVTGHQQYTINYTLQNVMTFYDDHDELYWDINGDQWAQPTQAVAVTIHIPSGHDDGQLKCFAGTFGEAQQHCAISKSNDGTILAATLAPLSDKQTLTTVVGFKSGYFVRPTKLDWLRDHAWQIVAVVVPPLLFGGWAFLRWRKYGKDASGRGTVIPEYQPPDKLLPIEVGMIYDYKVDTKDISATIIDLAVRKYLQIIETKQKKILKDTTSYSFKLLNADTKGLSPFEIEIVRNIFPSLTVGSEVELSSLKNSFYKTSKKLQSSVPLALTAKGYFESDPTKAGNRMHGLGIALFIVGWIIHSWVSLGFIVAAFILIGFGTLMSKRSAKGVQAKADIEGLKMYMNVAEKDRLTMMQAVDARYTATSPEPKKTVDLFEKLLPYAIVLGVEASWAKEFEGIYTTPPGWYQGNWNTFNSVYFASSLSNSMNAMATSFNPPSNSSSGGFGGGGFSGGGGGGGGGGGW